MYEDLKTINAIDRFTESMILAARRRYNRNPAELKPMSIDDVETVIRACGYMSTEMLSKNIDMGTVGTSMLFFVEGIQHVINPETQMRNQKTHGGESKAQTDDNRAAAGRAPQAEAGDGRAGEAEEGDQAQGR